MTVTSFEMQDILADYVKTYYEIIGKNGICKKSNEYARKIDRLEIMILLKKEHEKESC